MTSNRTTSREESIYEMMGYGGGILQESAEMKKMSARVREKLLSPDFNVENLSVDEKHFVQEELKKLAKVLHREDQPNARLNQVLESENSEQMVQFARDHILAKLENSDSDKVVPIQKKA